MQFLFRRLLLVVATLLAATYAMAAASPIQIDWPKGWQASEPVIQEHVTRQLARVEESGDISHSLNVMIIDVSKSNKAITNDDIRSLVTKMKAVALEQYNDKAVPLKAMSSGSGYYFSVKERKQTKKQLNQMISGIVLEGHYLIEFTLLANEIDSSLSKHMLLALSRSSVKK